MDLLRKIDANLTLKQTEQRCEVEQNAGFELESIKFGTIIEGGTVLQVNKAEFVSKPVGRLKNLDFVEVGAQNPETLKKSKTDAGWKFICDTQMYVQNNVKRVMVFGKKQAEA
ncbi:MAG TPA: hypothetical protein VF668_17555 [Pyrinomonadaceae bacterium]|jgi:hypothetical protein